MGKTHKTGSRTLTTILNRYALTHNLSVAVRKELNRHRPSQVKPWINEYRPLPPGVDHYDMLTDHARFDEGSLRHFLPEDTVLISIVREPLARFVSGFYFIRHQKLLRRVPGPEPVLTYLSNLSRWDRGYGSMVHSKMAYDFGLDFKNFKDPEFLPRSIQYLSRVFHLVMLTESYDESMVLLRRRLSWTLPDMIYVKFHVQTNRPNYNFTRKQKRDFEQKRKEEYAIYGHFRSLFREKLLAQDESFVEEVRVFKSMRGNVASFCQNITAARPKKREVLMVEGTRFSDRFRMTLEDCELLMRPSSAVNDHWFEEVMIKRLEEWHEAWKRSQ